MYQSFHFWTWFYLKKKKKKFDDALIIYNKELKQAWTMMWENTNRGEMCCICLNILGKSDFIVILYIR